MKSILLLSILFVTNIAYANKDVTLAIHQHYVTPRSVGMGGAINTIVDDYSALFFNPAALSRLKNRELNANIQGVVSPDFLDFTDELSKANEVGADDSIQRQQAILDVLNKYQGKHFHGRANMGLIYTRPNWGLALIPLDLSLELGINQTIGSELSAEVYQDTTLAFGMSRRIKKLKGITLGATIKSIYRGYIAKDLQAVDLVDDEIINDEDFQEGLNVDLDIGLLYEPHWWKYKKMVPTFSLVVRNILDYGYIDNFELLNDSSTEPPKMQRRIDIGNSWQLPRFWVFDPKIAIEVHNLLHDYYNINKGLHIGAELGWKAGSLLEGAYRLGMHQGYFTAGISAQLWAFKLDLATYSAEVGTESIKIEDRRYAVNMSLDF